LLSHDHNEAGIYAVQYEGKQLERDLLQDNTPNYTLDELTESVRQDLQEAGVFDKPCLIVAYSMGGLLARSLSHH
jgi:surfactin synthase thioesterase subunit